MTEDQATLAERQWRETAPETVLLDGFHALKHALRFGASVRVAVTSDKAAAVELAAELAGDLTEVITDLLVEVPDRTLRALVPRVHPTRVAALAVRRGRQGNLDALARQPRPAPVVVLDNPRNLPTTVPWSGSPRGSGPREWSPPGTSTPGTRTPCARVRASTSPPRSNGCRPTPSRRDRCTPWTRRGRTSGPWPSPMTPFWRSAPSATGSRRSCARGPPGWWPFPFFSQVSYYNLATSVAMALFHWGGPPAHPRDSTV
ncbi:putative rRNA methylase [Streptomyces himastatinicus ATCC 53653]|uniref:Putative rRNA methylase n=1 Tax=Streptomyces himastatinicus ATCC 53653 TaxID=457427 RepID=D9W6W9_9ACTN|nr:putative rRNA methylase [Streptomyces himastatinicus ATCC 53653]